MATPVYFMIKHKYAGKFIVPEGEENNPDDGTYLVLEDTQHERMYFTFDVIEGVWGYIRHMASGKIFNPYYETLHPSNNSKVVLHSDRHAAALFSIDQVNDLIIHRGGQRLNTKGANPNPQANTCVRLWDTDNDAGKWLFVSPTDPDNEVLVYGSPTLSGYWNIINMILNPLAEHSNTVQVKHGKSNTTSSGSTFQFDWEIDAKASLLFDSVSTDTTLSYMVENTTSLTWSKETSVSKKIKVPPGQSVVTWQYVFTGEQSGNKAVFQSAMLADTDSPNVKPGLPSTTQGTEQDADEKENSITEEEEEEEEESAAKSLIQDCEKLQDGYPALYKIPFQKSDEDAESKTRTLEFGSSDLLEEKTIMLVGTAKPDKGTLIDGLVNHVFGVVLKNRFRFKAIDPKDDKTDWITRYRIHPLTDTQTFILNIIDIPDFGEAERDRKMVERIRQFVTKRDGHGIETIDMVCFVAEATVDIIDITQTYILGEIRAIFGEDIKENVVAMLTGGDANEPRVSIALSQAQIPANRRFVFNNSGSENEATRSVRWDMCTRSYGVFLECLTQMTPVVTNRERIKTTIQTLRPEIDNGLMQLETIRKDCIRVEISKMEFIDETTYYEDEFRINRIALDPDVYVTNCVVCHMTCHFPCGIPDDEGKIGCLAMTDGYCTVCPKKCYWDNHRNNDYRLETEVVRVEKTFREMKVVYGITTEETVTKATLARAVRNKFHEGKAVVRLKLAKVRKRVQYLEAQGNKDNKFSEEGYIDHMIEVEQQVENPGFMERVKILTILRKIGMLETTAMEDPDELLKQVGFYEE